MAATERPFLNNAGGVEKLIQEMNKAREYLTQTRTNLASHIKTVHNGLPATTCHRCMSYQQGIQSNEKFIQEVNRELGNLS